MINGTKEAVRYMKDIFVNYWHKELKYYCVYQNLMGKTPPENQPYAKFDIIHLSADRVTLNGRNKTKFRQRGFINIQIFVPTNTGVEDAYDYAQNVMNLYRRPPHDCPINFSTFDFKESDLRYNDFYKIRVSIGFDYDYHF